MKNFFLAVLYILSLGVPLSSNATQIRQEKSHRSYVLEALSKRQCVLVYSAIPRISTEPVTRSATRGLTRGVRGFEFPSSRAFIPEIAEQIHNFSIRFKELIKLEFGLPFGGGDNLSTYQFLIRDQSESKEKLFWTKKLGFEWSGRDEPSQSPDWITLATNYKKALVELGINEKDYFVPVMVFHKDTMVFKSGVMTPSKDYRFVDPLKEDINGLTTEWKILTSDVQFNLPFSAMMDAMKQGQFPMLDAVHDIYHFVSFLRFVDGTKALLAAIRATPANDFSSGFKRREYWLTEALSIMLPDSKLDNVEFLNSQRAGSIYKPIKQVRQELQTMPETELVKYSLALASHMESQLRDVSGGNSSPAEKWFYLGDIVGVPGRDLVDHKLSPKQDLSAIVSLSDSYFRNGPVVYAGNPKPMTNETATFSFSTFNLAHRLLAQGLRSGFRNHFKKGITKKQLMQDLLEYTARTEHWLRSEPPTPAHWYSQFISKDMDPNGQMGQMLSTFFDNELVIRFYLGEGEKRAVP